LKAGAKAPVFFFDFEMRSTKNAKTRRTNHEGQSLTRNAPDKVLRQKNLKSRFGITKTRRVEERIEGQNVTRKTPDKVEGLRRRYADHSSAIWLPLQLT
jgi:hypothetical protein